MSQKKTNNNKDKCDTEAVPKDFDDIMRRLVTVPAKPKPKKKKKKTVKKKTD